MNRSKPLTLPVFGIARHRLTTDGVGVSTLVGAYGCPLKCRFCLNPHAWNPETLKGCRHYTPEALFDVLKIDDLYFQATGGGVTFGGGESLLHTPFIRDFRKICEEHLSGEHSSGEPAYCWKITAETSLNVSGELLDIAILCVDDFIIDIKDMNPDIYREYTGSDNARVLSNLTHILEKKGPQHLFIRVPQIPEYQKKEDVISSVEKLKNMGFTNIEVFPYIKK